MTEPSQQRLFLERRSYQRRRLMDAARLLPVLGVLLWLVPLVWARASGPGDAVSVVSASFYIFGVWTALIIIGALISRKLAIEPPAERPPQDPAADRPEPSWNS